MSFVTAAQGPGHACLGPSGTSKNWQLPVAAQSGQGCEVTGTGTHACHLNQPSHRFHCFISVNYHPPPRCLARRAGHNPALRHCMSHPCPGGTSRHPPPLLQKTFGPTPQFWFGRAPSCRCPLLAPPLMLGTCYWWEEKAQLLGQHPHGSLAKLVRCQGTMWALAGIAGGNGASAVPKAIAIPIALTS